MAADPHGSSMHTASARAGQLVRELLSQHGDKCKVWNLRGNRLSDDDAGQLAAFLETTSSTALTCVDISNNYVDTEGLATLFQALNNPSKYPRFKWLVCIANPCAGVNSRAFFKTLSVGDLSKLVWFPGSGIVARHWATMLSMDPFSGDAELLADAYLSFWREERLASAFPVATSGDADRIIFGSALLPCRPDDVQSIQRDLSQTASHASNPVLASLIENLARNRSGSVFVTVPLAVEFAVRYISGFSLPRSYQLASRWLEYVLTTSMFDLIPITRACNVRIAQAGSDRPYVVREPPVFVVRDDIEVLFGDAWKAQLVSLVVKYEKDNALTDVQRNQVVQALFSSDAKKIAQLRRAYEFHNEALGRKRSTELFIAMLDTALEA